MDQKPLIRNAADEAQLEDAKEKLRHSKNRAENRWKKAVHDDEICALLLGLIRDFHTDENPVIKGDHLETYRRIGIQAAGKTIRRKLMEADRQKFLEQEIKLGEVI